MKSDMKRQKKKKFGPIISLILERWGDKKTFFGTNICQAKSGVILNLRDEECDEEMKIKISVQTYIKPNLVLSQIWEMKIKISVQTYIKPNLVFSQIWEMKR